MKPGKKGLTVVMQILLGLLFISGLLNRSPKILINAGLGLAVTFAPAYLERNHNVTLNPFLSLWVTTAVFLHAVGSYGFYGAVPGWDHVTHATSASLVAAIGYTLVRSVELHSDDIKLPKSFMFLFILMTILAVGVTWELFEYGLDQISHLTGIKMPLSQVGLQDTMKDMIFNFFGAAITATLGQAYLTDLAKELRQKIQE